MSHDSPLILVVEDEPAFVEALEVGLSREGFRVRVARDGLEALEAFAAFDPDLVLLDVMLPKLSGIDVCRQIRKTSSVPIVMVTAKVSEIDTVVGLEVGADDYVAKPYRLRELVARIRAALRRAPSDEQETEAGGGVRVAGGVSIDIDSHVAVVDGTEVTLPLKEFDLLAALVERAGKVVSREALIDRVWGFDYVGDTKTLDVHIKRLRSKVEVDPAAPKRITTIRGVGYKFQP